MRRGDGSTSRRGRGYQGGRQYLDGNSHAGDDGEQEAERE